jgi:hypothetical protein
MKKLLGIIVLGLILTNNSFAGDCSGCESEAYDAYRDARKAYRSNNLSDCQRYAKRAYRHASYTEDYARDCSY